MRVTTCEDAYSERSDNEQAQLASLSAWRFRLGTFGNIANLSLGGLCKKILPCEPLWSNIPAFFYYKSLQKYLYKINMLWDPPFLEKRESHSIIFFYRPQITGFPSKNGLKGNLGSRYFYIDLRRHMFLTISDVST